MTSTSEKFIRILREKTPTGFNTVDMLTEIIPMSKEAAYRRLRGQIEFSFEEIMKIAKKLDISLDNLNKEESSHYYKISRSPYLNESSFMEDYIQWHEKILEATIMLRNKPDHYVTSINNSISILYLYRYGMISKLRLYKWAYQRNTQSKPVKMANFHVSPKAIYLEKMMIKELLQTRIYFIYAQEIIKSLVNDINYFRNLDLISQAETNQMKEETLSLLSDMEHDAILGKNGEGPCTIHLTSVDFDGDFILWHSEKSSRITFRLFGVNFFTIEDPEAIDEMKNWTNVLLKSSTLISFSGEKKRMEFFRQQRKILELL